MIGTQSWAQVSATDARNGVSYTWPYRFKIGTGTDRDVRIPQLDRLRGRHDRLEAGSAQAIHVEGGRLLRYAGIHRRDPAEVGVPRFGRNHVAHDNMADFGRVHAGAVQGTLDCHGGESCQRDIPQRSAEASNRGARRADHDDVTFAHFQLGGVPDQAALAKPKPGKALTGLRGFAVSP